MALLSIGGAQTSQVEKDAIRYAIVHGVLVVAAAGNTGLGGNVKSYPAALVGTHGLAVASSTSTGKRASFSTVARYVSLAAPGVRVLGATVAAASASEFPRATLPADGLYAYGTGTSYSAPQVAGAAALVWAANPSLTADGVIAILEQTASGAGKWNAGDGVRRTIRFLEKMDCTILSGHRRVRPFGLAGGEAGQIGENWVRRRDGRMERLAGCDATIIDAGEAIIIQPPTAGGYGERDGS